MLVTRELVNDVVAGDALLVSYCPLCGTGIVFDRTVSGTVYEFGVSGMLWQSNLLIYNRVEDIEERSLWSQVLGEAVVGSRTGTVLLKVPSDIMKFGADAYVYGIEVKGIFKAYPRDLLQEGENYDMISGTEITINNIKGKVLFTNAQGVVIEDVEGFWFSWVAAHPETQVWTQ